MTKHIDGLNCRNEHRAPLPARRVALGADVQMAKGQLRFKQREVARAIRAAARSGVPTKRVEIDNDGKISVILGKPDDGATNGENKNPWDEVLNGGAH